MKVALGIAATTSEVTAALVDVELPSLGPVDERITPLNANSATVGDAVAAAIGVMRLRAIQNGLDLQGTMVSSANRVQRESISSALGMHKIEGVDVVDATYLSPAFEPSVSTALWNVDGVGRVAADPVDAGDIVKPVKASRMEKFGRAQKARSAEKALAVEDVPATPPSPATPDPERPKRTTRAALAASAATPNVEKVTEAPDLLDAEVPKAELAIPPSIAKVPVTELGPAEPKTAEPKPAEPKPDRINGAARSLNLGEDSVPKQVSSNGHAATNGHAVTNGKAVTNGQSASSDTPAANGTARSYVGVSSHADTTETTAIDSAAIVAALGVGYRDSGPIAAPAARRRPRQHVQQQYDPYDSPMTEPIDIVGPMVTRQSQAGTRERGAALIISGVVALILAALVAMWALSGTGKSAQVDTPGNAGVSGPLTSESSSAVVVPPTSVSAPVSSEPRGVPPTDSETPTDEVPATDPSVDLEGAPASAVATRSSRPASTQTQPNSSVAEAGTKVSAPVNGNGASGRPATGGGTATTAPTKVVTEPATVPVETAPATGSITPTDPSTSGQTVDGAGSSGGGGTQGDQSPTNAGE